MEKTIDGYLYNTRAKGTVVIARTDSSIVQPFKTLYRTANGRYFMHIVQFGGLQQMIACDILEAKRQYGLLVEVMPWQEAFHEKVREA